jgi:two-component system, NarL family, sensor histidine kinase UhpB
MAMPLRLLPLAGSRNFARAYPIAVVLFVLVPALILAAYLSVHLARLQRAHLEQRARDQAREATAAIEREVIAIQNVLLALSSSPFLERNEIEAFYRQATDVSRKTGLVFVLHDIHLRQLANTALPWGKSLDVETLPKVSAAYERLLRSGHPGVSDLFFGPFTKQNIVAVFIPVFRGGNVDFVLTAGVPAKIFDDLLENLGIRSDLTVNIIDQNNVFVARSTKQDQYVGTRAAIAVPPEERSVVTGVSREGVAFHAFNRHSQLFGWGVSVGIPDYVLEAPMRWALGRVAVAGSVLLALAVGLANVWGGRVARSIGALGIDRRPTRKEFEVLFDSAPNGVMVVDDHGRIVLFNAQIADKFGYSVGELIGKPIEVLVPERFRSPHVRLRQAFVLNPRARPMGEGRDLHGLRKDGTEFPVEIGLNPINSGAEKLVMITIIDISRRRLAQERLEATTADRDDLRRRLLEAHEQERLRLAHELHDQTGQSLTGAMLELKAYEDSQPEPDRTRLRLLRLQLEHVGQALHHVVWKLRPPSIDEFGIQSALDEYTAEWSAQCGIDADFHCSGLETEEVSEEASTAVYRIVQEALTNVIKHAHQATSVSVVVERTGSLLQLTVEDNGCGFDTNAPSARKGGPNGGLGLAGMRERLTLIGGELEVESSIGVGTTIFARIPLKSVRAAA